MLPPNTDCFGQIRQDVASVVTRTSGLQKATGEALWSLRQASAYVQRRHMGPLRLSAVYS